MVNPLTWEWRSPSILSRWYKSKNVPHSFFFHPSNQHLNCVGWFSNHFRHFCLRDQPMVTTTFNGTLYGTTASKTVPLLGVLPMAAVTQGSCHHFSRWKPGGWWQHAESTWEPESRRKPLGRVDNFPPPERGRFHFALSEFVDVRFCWNKRC